MKTDKEIETTLDELCGKHKELNAQKEILDILHCYLKVAMKAKDEVKIKEIMKEIKYFSTSKLSKKEAEERLMELLD